MLAMLLFQLGIALGQARRARALASDLLLADARHTLADVFVTVAAIAGWQLSAYGVDWADSTLTVLVAIVVLVFALGLFRRVIPILVDGSAHEPDALRSVAEAVEGVREVTTVRSRWIGSETAIDVVVNVDQELLMS